MDNKSKTYTIQQLLEIIKEQWVKDHGKLSLILEDMSYYDLEAFIRLSIANHLNNLNSLTPPKEDK